MTCRTSPILKKRPSSSRLPGTNHCFTGIPPRRGAVMGSVTGLRCALNGEVVDVAGLPLPT